MILIYLLNVFFISRLFTYFDSLAENKTKAVKKTLIQALGLILIEYSWKVILLFICLMLLNYLFYFLSKKIKNSDSLRIKESIGILIALLFFSSPFINLDFNYRFIYWLQSSYPFVIISELFSYPDWDKSCLFLFGLLFLMLESSIIIKVILKKLNLGINEIDTQKESDDQKLSGAGKLIGILERIFIYILILLGQYSAIGLIIAAKSFARFKALDKRYFAEYVLIGTLISALFAFLTALLVADKL